MSNFICPDCGAKIIDSPKGYITECEHWPLEKQSKRFHFQWYGLNYWVEHKELKYD